MGETRVGRARSVLYPIGLDGSRRVVGRTALLLTQCLPDLTKLNRKNQEVPDFIGAPDTIGLLRFIGIFLRIVDQPAPNMPARRAGRVTGCRLPQGASARALRNKRRSVVSPPASRIADESKKPQAFTRCG
jgi:hypothetical protein